MYKNVFGEKVSKVRFKEMANARKNRRELVAENFDRRQLMKRNNGSSRYCNRANAY